MLLFPIVLHSGARLLSTTDFHNSLHHHPSRTFPFCQHQFPRPNTQAKKSSARIYYSIFGTSNKDPFGATPPRVSPPFTRLMQAPRRTSLFRRMLPFNESPSRTHLVHTQEPHALLHGSHSGPWPHGAEALRLSGTPDPDATCCIQNAVGGA